MEGLEVVRSPIGMIAIYMMQMDFLIIQELVTTHRTGMVLFCQHCGSDAVVEVTVAFAPINQVSIIRRTAAFDVNMPIRAPRNCWKRLLSQNLASVPTRYATSARVNARSKAERGF